MAKNRTFYAKRNILYGIINKIVVIFLPFIIRTITIQQLGAEYLGLGSLFTSILQTFSVAEMGFSSAVVFKMYKPLADRDDNKVCALLALYRKVYKVIGFGILTVGLIITPFLKYLINGSYPIDINIYILFLIYLSGTVISYLGVAYKTSLLSASQRQDVVSNVDTVLTIIRSVIQIFMLCFFRNYYAYVVWTPISTLVNNFIISVISRKLYPQYECRGKLKKTDLKDITKQIKGLAIGKIGYVSRNSFDSITLSMYSGLVAVTIYSNYYYIFTAITGFMSVIITSITGGIGNSLVTESSEKNYINFKRFNFYYMWIAGWFTVCLYCLYQPFMRLWVGEELTATKTTMLLFSIYFYITHMGQIRSAYAGAAGIWWEFRRLQIVEAIANLLLNFILGYFWGMNGILIATIFTVTVCSIIGIGAKSIRYLFNRSSVEYFVFMGEYAFVTVLTCIMTERICCFFTVKGLVEIMCRGMICILLPNLIFGFFAIVTDEHRNMLLSVKRFIKK